MNLGTILLIVLVLLQADLMSMLNVVSLQVAHHPDQNQLRRWGLEIIVIRPQ